MTESDSSANSLGLQANAPENAHALAEARTPAPRALKIVSLLFVASGVFSALEMAASCFNNRFVFDFGVLGFWIGSGLLRFDRRMLRWGRFLTWLSLIGVDIISFALAVGSPDPKFKFGGWSTPAPIPLLVTWLTVFAALDVWKLHVLKRADIDALFPPEEIRQFRSFTAALTNAPTLMAPVPAAPMPTAPMSSNAAQLSPQRELPVSGAMGSGAEPPAPP